MYIAIGGVAAAENIFPPLPADTAIALGAFLSQYGTVSAVAVFGITWTANVAGATAVYVAGRMLGRPFFAGRLGRRLLKPRALSRLEELYDRHGEWGIFLSRFVPGVRAVVPVFAGVARLSSPRALVPVVIASAIWYGTLTIVVVQLAGSLEDVVLLLDRVNLVALLVVLVLVAVIGTMVYVRWSKREGTEGLDGIEGDRDEADPP